MRPPSHINTGRSLASKSGGNTALRAVRMINEERQRQISGEGWSIDHDDAHDDGELLKAANFYFINAMPDGKLSMRDDGAPVGWPWEAKWWKPKDRKQDLVRAGALYLAERERLLRINGKINVTHIDRKHTLVAAALAQLL